MAPGGGGKRKRGDRTYSQDSSHDGLRPSPHRPGSLSLAQQGYQNQGQQQHHFGRDQQDQRNRGGRRGSRGGRGNGPLRSPHDSPNAIPIQSRQNISNPSAMFPPLAPTQQQDEPKQTTLPRLSVPVAAASTQTPASQSFTADTYYYDYLTKEATNTWQQSGRKAVMERAVRALDDEDPLVLGVIFQEIIRSALDGRLTSEDAGGLVKEIIDQNTGSNIPLGTPLGTSPSVHFDAISLFLDCLSILTETETINPALQSLIVSTGIPPLIMRQQLESTLLQNIGLIRDTFFRMGIRKQTNLLYRQANYNLLREETEGYSKLVTELFTTSSNEPPTAEVVEDTFERVKGMIGTFDLDVGRVLDVTLDVFAAVLVKQYRFFVKYLRVSSWWPQQDSSANDEMTSFSYHRLPKWALPGVSGWSILNDEERNQLSRSRNERDRLLWERVRQVGMSAFFEMGGRSVGETASQAGTNTESKQDQPQDDEDRKWMETTGVPPPTGNKIVAQVLGFKLRFYSSSARDPSDVLPGNLIYLAALLIKIGFISLRDLYPHLWPADEAMEAVREEKMREKLEREKLNRPGGGAMNALMTAGALADDTLPASSRLRETDGNRGPLSKPDPNLEKAGTAPKVEEKEQLPEPLDQKVQLLKSLLCIGAIPEALYILGRFPWLPDAFPDLPEYIHRILNHCISRVYEPLQPLHDRCDLREPQKIVNPDQTGLPKGQIRQIEQPARKILRWAQLDKDDTNEGTDYRFYWDDWADNVPVCQSVDDVFSLCGTLLNLSGVKIGQDPTLLLKLARIGNHSLATDTSESNRTRWIDLSKRLIVPALSLTSRNPGVVNEVFDLIKHFSTTTRFSIYAEWYLGATSRLPDIKAAFDLARAETKDVLKRISKTNVKPMARALAKVAYASPGIVFSVAIGQIESYDNLVEVVVECARYFTYLGYDVLTWSLMSSLGARGRNRVQADGMLTSRWLAALSLFAGKVFKRYSIMSPTPILQYVAEQLRKSNSTDLIVLEEITTSMAGIVSDTNFNEAQVLSMAGGDLLQAQTMLQLLDRRHESKTTARRLMKSLVEPKLAGQLLILIAQERQTCIFKIAEPDAHLKLLGNLFDEIHRVFTQYLDLLRSNLSVKEFDSLVPEVSRLICDFGIEPGVAFWVGRPSIAAAMADHDLKITEKGPERKDLPAKDVPDAVSAQDTEMVDGDKTVGEQDLIEYGERRDRSPVSTDQLDNIKHNAVAKESSESNLILPSDHGNNEVVQPWHPILRNIMETIRSTLPESTWENLSESFYVTFWQLSLGDMLVPTQSYDDEINRQKKKILAINSDRSDISVAGTQKKEREKKALTDLQDRLRTELKDQVQAYSLTRTRLQKEKEHWFVNSWGRWDALNIALIEHCFFPRILISPIDAIYTFKMLKFLHSSGATNFRTMGVFDQLFNEKRLTSMIFLCTSKEAENIGRFLNEVLRDLTRWHTDKAIFEKEAYGTKKDLPGFCKKMANAKTVSTFLPYEDFRRILLKWHRNLNGALKTCITGGEYMHIRNAIIILRTICLYFPAINWMGQAQVASIEELSKAESREDLKLAAASLLGNLKRREKDWMLPQAFNLNEGSTNGTNGVRATSAKPPTPQREIESNKPLNAKAPELNPTTHANAITTLRKSSIAPGRLEVEDGEIDDANTANLTTKPASLRNPLQLVELASVSQATPPTIPQKQVTSYTQSEEATQAPEPSIEESKLPTAPSTAPEPPQSQRNPLQSVADTSASHSHIPARADIGRNFSDQTTNPRPQHALPNRPDPPPPRANEHRVIDRNGDRGPRNSNDLRFPDPIRNDRSSEAMRERVDHHVSGTHFRGPERPLDRPPFDERDRPDQAWGSDKSAPARSHSDNRYPGPHHRDLRPPSRDFRPERSSRDRQHDESLENPRHTEVQGRSSRDSSMAPPRSAVLQHPDRATLIHGPHDQDRGHSNVHSDRRPDPPWYDSHPNSQRGSRTTSPARHDDTRMSQHEIHRDRNDRNDRPNLDSRRPLEDIPRSRSSRHDDSRPPTGPRTDRPGETAPLSSGDRFRDSLRGGPPSNIPPADLNHGRLNQDYNGSHRQAESQYGRLTSGPEIPSGPRLPNGTPAASNRGGGRNASGSQPHINTQQPPLLQNPMPSPTVPGQGAPTGPSLGRAPLRDPAYLNRPPSAPSSTPATPVTETPDVAGIHPDRLKAIQGPEVSVASVPNASASDPAHGVNPMPPSPVSAPPPAAPRGPNNAQPLSPLGPPRQGPPTGPSFANDRNRSDKRFAGIQNVLQQAGAPNSLDRSNQGASIRGRGGRPYNPMNHSSSSPVTSGPPTPHTARHEAFPSRADLFAGRSSGPGTPQHGEEDMSQGRDMRRDRVRDDGDRRSGQDREGSTSSRDRLPGGNGGLLPQVPPTIRDDGRPFRRGDEYGPDVERGGMAADADRQGRGSGRDSGKDRERRAESDRRDLAEWGGDRRGPGPDRRNDQDRERRDGGRKRGRGVEDSMGPRPGPGQGERGYGGDIKRSRRNG